MNALCICCAISRIRTLGARNSASFHFYLEREQNRWKCKKKNTELWPPSLLIVNAQRNSFHSKDYRIHVVFFKCKFSTLIWWYYILSWFIIVLQLEIHTFNIVDIVHTCLETAKRHLSNTPWREGAKRKVSRHETRIYLNSKMKTAEHKEHRDCDNDFFRITC